MNEQDKTVLINMEKYGGSFVKALAKAAMHADENNLRRLREAFPDYWFRYSGMTDKPPVPLKFLRKTEIAAEKDK